MVKILGLSGSLRQKSFNTALLRAAAALPLEGAQIDACTLHGIPLYDGDLEEREGLPAAVLALRERLLAADGLLLVSPEYNNGVPGVLKNALDWLSRPAAGLPEVLQGRPVALMGASTGGFGTQLGQAHWLPVLRTLRMQHWTAGRLLVSRAQGSFGPDGSLQDDALRRQLLDFVQGYARFLAALAQPAGSR